MKLRYLFVALMLVAAGCSTVDTPTPTPTEPAPSPVEPTPTPIEPDPISIISVDYKKIAEQVDKYRNSNQLLKDRQGTTFAKSIHSAVKESMINRTLPLGSYIEDVFSIKGSEKVSLQDKLCEYDNSIAERVLRTSVSSSGLSLINRFVKEVNNSSPEGKEEVSACSKRDVNSNSINDLGL